MCLKCKRKTTYKESSRIHGKPPRKFFICCFCGEEVQGVYRLDGSVHEFPTSAYKGGSHVVTLRLSDVQLDEFKATNQTSRSIFELGLETYKSLSNNLEK